MKEVISWKAALTILIVVWAASNLIPWKDTPFEEYIVAEASANQEEFKEIIARAEQNVAANPSDNPTLYVALRRLVEQESIDLARFFPHINVQDQRNVQKRNDILTRELLRLSQGKVRFGLDLKGGVSVVFRLDENALAQQEYERQTQIDRARAVIADRVDGLGVAEPVIRSRGETQIEIQMPGVDTRQNPDILETIGAPALLEFSVVHRTANPMASQEAPVGYVKKVQEYEDPQTGEIIEMPLFIRRIPLMTGEIIQEARAVPGEYGGYKIALAFTSEGSEQFARHTRAIAEENQRSGSTGRLAIILDGKLHSAPSVREEIQGGAEITGSFTQREAIDLANVLNNPLEVGLQVEEMSEVGPTLAQEAREASLKAGLLGAILVFIFMLVYYRWAGLIAIKTVILNLIIVVGTLTYFDATLTLPGIAALVLTIGMAVDANILIFERLREERRAGKSLPAALESAFDKAFSTIVDANLTTLITALILVWLGSGPVKGFGFTLAVGILSTMFCSLIVSRWMFDVLVHNGIMKKLSFGTIIKEGTSAQFLDFAKKGLIGAAVVIVIGVVSFALHFNKAFGIDFTGGDEITLSYNQAIETADIERVAAEIGLSQATASRQTIIGSEVEVMKIQTPPGQGAALFEALQTAYPDAGLEFVGETHIGSAVGKEVRYSAILAVLAALVGILLYTAIRFEWGYGVGALVALAHDVLTTIGIFFVLGEFFGIGSGQFNAPMIAAILMVLGYSINDTIVIFDRIREELDLNPGMKLRGVIHLAINRTLGRTIMTSLTTLLATLALVIFGAGIIVDFALVFFIGILTGTFSSIFIASPIFFYYHKGDRHRVEESHFLPTYEWSNQHPSKPAAKSAN